MADRGYRLPPMGERDVPGTQRALLWDLIQADDGPTVANRIRRAPEELRTPRPFGDLIGWLLMERESRSDAVGPDPRSLRSGVRSTTEFVRVAEVWRRAEDDPPASATAPAN